MDEWERTKRAAEAALEDAKQRKLESAKVRALQQAGDLMERLTDVMPKLDAGVTPKELLEEKYLQDLADAAMASEGLFGAEEHNPEEQTVSESFISAEPSAEEVPDTFGEPPQEEVPYIPGEPEVPDYLKEPVTGIEPETADILSGIQNVAEPEAADYLPETDTVTEPEVTDYLSGAGSVAEPEGTDYLSGAASVAEPGITDYLSGEDTSAEPGVADYLPGGGTSAEPEGSDYLSGESSAAEPGVLDYQSDAVTATEPESSGYFSGEDTVAGQESKDYLSGTDTKTEPEVTEYLKEPITGLESEVMNIPLENHTELEVQENLSEADNVAETGMPDNLSGADSETEPEVPDYLSAVDTSTEMEKPAEPKYLQRPPEEKSVKQSSSFEETHAEEFAFVRTRPQDRSTWKEKTIRIPDIPDLEDLGDDTASEDETPALELTDEQKAVFSYFMPVKGMEDQLCKALAGISKRLKDKGNADHGNLIIQGSQGSGRTTLATSIIKVLQQETGYPDGKIGKIQAEVLNEKDLVKLLRKVSGGCLIIEQAGGLSLQAELTLSLLMEQNDSGLLVILEDTSKGIKKLLAQDEGFARKFTEQISVPIFTNDELVTFARSYSRELGYKIDDMAVLALYNRISNIQRLDQATTLTEVKEIVDEAIDREAHGGLKKAFSILTANRYTDDDRIVLREKDFE